MITKNIVNSSNKIMGVIEFDNNQITIKNKQKPLLIINNEYVIQNALQQQYNAKLIQILFDQYCLLIAEIAAIMGVYYCRANQWIKITDVMTSMRQGRRNSSYGVTFSKQRKEKTKNQNKGKQIYNNGKYEKFFSVTDVIPEGFTKGRLPFSESHIQKIKEAGLSGKFCSPTKRAHKGWDNGKFRNVNFKRGIGGYFSSQKINKRFFFRSLLELYYIINFLEENDTVQDYSYEPFTIHCDNGSLYTPDFLINHHKVVELKSYNFIYKQGGKIQKDFEYKQQQGIEYCKNHNLEYIVIFDKDINFKYDVLLHQLQNSLYIDKYHIEFLEPDRVWSKK